MERWKYRIEAFYSSSEVDRGYDASYGAETLKMAKERAKYMLSEKFTRATEMSSTLKYARVMLATEKFEADDEMVWDIEIT